MLGPQLFNHGCPAEWKLEVRPVKFIWPRQNPAGSDVTTERKVDDPPILALSKRETRREVFHWLCRLRQTSEMFSGTGMKYLYRMTDQILVPNVTLQGQTRQYQSLWMFGSSMRSTVLPFLYWRKSTYRQDKPPESEMNSGLRKIGTIGQMAPLFYPAWIQQRTPRWYSSSDSGGVILPANYEWMCGAHHWRYSKTMTGSLQQ